MKEPDDYDWVTIPLSVEYALLKRYTKDPDKYRDPFLCEIGVSIYKFMKEIEDAKLEQ